MERLEIFGEPVPLYDLERFYDRLIDAQFWFEREYYEIERIDKVKHTALYKIYFSPIILVQLSILDSFHICRRVELIKLVDLFATLYKQHYGDKPDLLHGLPPMPLSSPMSAHPRIRLPDLIPPPPITVVTPIEERSPPPIMRQPPNYYYTYYRNYLDYRPSQHEQ